MITSFANARTALVDVHVEIVRVLTATSLPDDPQTARKRAEDILKTQKYRPKKASSPLQKQMDWIGRQLGRVFRPIADAFSKVIPGSGAMEVIAAVALAIAVSVVVSRYLINRRARAADEASDGRKRRRDLTELENAAADAYARGDFRTALLIRFRIGILKLSDGPLPEAESQTNSAIAAVVPESFPPIGETFDAARYGDRPVNVADADASLTAWPQVLSDAKAAARSGAKTPRRRRRTNSETVS